MLQNILKIDGVTPLEKTAQKSIKGGNNCNNYSGAFCYGPYPGCGSCGDYQALPAEFKNCVLVHMDCVEDETPM